MTEEEILNKSISRHTFFQLNFFVLGKEPTHQAKMHRCIEELKTRKNTLNNVQMELEDIKDRNELFFLEMSEGEFKSVEEKTIRLRMIKRKIDANEKEVERLKDIEKNTQEEILFFVEAFNKLNEVEPMKQWDDIDVQTEYWNTRLSEDVNHRILMHLPLDVEIIKTVLALPKETSVNKQVVYLLNKNIERLKDVL